jgi:hypothetical protein
VGANAAVLGEVQVHPTKIPPAGEEEKDEGGAAYEEQIENAKKYEALCDANHVAAIRDSERNWIQEPKQVNKPRETSMITAYP